ncbi:hypothetical protein R6Q59_019940 [Mikania micrantha]
MLADQGFGIPEGSLLRRLGWVRKPPKIRCLLVREGIRRSRQQYVLAVKTNFIFTEPPTKAVVCRIPIREKSRSKDFKKESEILKHNKRLKDYVKGSNISSCKRKHIRRKMSQESPSRKM